MRPRLSIQRAVNILSLLLVMVLSLGTSWVLFNLNKELIESQQLFDDNLPSYSVKAEYEVARMISSLNKFSLGTASREEIHLRFDIFLARLNHYEAAFTSENLHSSLEVRDRLTSLRNTMLRFEDAYFALQSSDTAAIAEIEQAFQGMYKPLEELSTLTRESHNMTLKNLDDRLARGVRIGFALILSTIVIGALTLALFWYNLKEKRRFSADLEVQIQKRTSDLQISNASLKREIVERQRAEQSLKEREQQMHRVQKMEAVGKVTTGVAHDFNNLLAVIMGNIELLKATADPKLFAKYLDSALAATVMGSQLTRKLLAFGRRSPLKPEVVDVNQVIVEIDDLLMHSLPENISLNLRLANEVWPISVDRSLLENVMLNLVINARDALIDGGCIIIETSNGPAVSGWLKNELHDSAHTDFVSVSITDAGTGMTAQVLEQAFEPFFSTKSETEGSGLGLSMVSGFVQQSDGYVDVTSAPGKGTCVQLLFPRSLSKQDTHHRDDAPQLQRTDKTRKILVVEDSDAVRQVVMEQLHALGYQTLEAANGADAFALVNTDLSIDLMLSDVVMPGELQGLELAERVRLIRPDLKIVIMSGYPKGSNHTEIEPYTPFTKLMKPVSITELSQAIRQELENDAHRLSMPTSARLNKA